ncbi:sigma-70 family RNA polymerase sigma factor [Paraconexibacter sp. AEG42_29]
MLTTLVARAPQFATLRDRGLADDVVHDVLLAVTKRIDDGNPIDDPFTYAKKCVVNLAIRNYDRANREATVEETTLIQLGPIGGDVADRFEQRAEMADVLVMIRSVNAVIEDLEPLELELVRAELARTDQKQLAARLGISRPTLYRRKRPAVAAFVAAVAERAGTRPCADHASALLAAAGGSGFDSSVMATAHAETCTECSETIRHLAAASHGLAMISPIPLVTVAEGDPSRLLTRAHTALETVADWTRAVIIRVGDPTPVGGSATKTVAIVAAACTGGGGIYCAVDGVPEPLTRPFGHHAKQDDSDAGKRRVETRKTAPVSSPAPVVQTVPVSLNAATLRSMGGAERAQRRAVAADAARARRAQVAKAKAAAARKREAAAAARRRAAAGGEFGTRQPATTGEFAPRSAPAAAAPQAREFMAPPAVPAQTTITKREFAPSAGGGGTSESGGAVAQTKREFGP